MSTAPGSAGLLSDQKAQRVFASVLDAGVKMALLILAAGFACYIFQLLPSAVPPERLPELWRLPAAQIIQHAGVAHGWGWMELQSGEVFIHAGLAFLLSISTLCLLSILPVYAARRDWAYVAIVILEIGVLLVSASGVLVLVR
jgi:hypothetical protein